MAPEIGRLILAKRPPLSLSHVQTFGGVYSDALLMIVEPFPMTRSTGRRRFETAPAGTIARLSGSRRAAGDLDTQLCGSRDVQSILRNEVKLTNVGGVGLNSTITQRPSGATRPGASAALAGCCGP